MVALQKKQSLLFIRCWLIQALKNKHICLKVSFFLITFLSWSSCPFNSVSLTHTLSVYRWITCSVLLSSKCPFVQLSVFTSPYTLSLSPSVRQCRLTCRTCVNRVWRQQRWSERSRWDTGPPHWLAKGQREHGWWHRHPQWHYNTSYYLLASLTAPLSSPRITIKSQCITRRVVLTHLCSHNQNLLVHLSHTVIPDLHCPE